MRIARVVVTVVLVTGAVLLVGYSLMSMGLIARGMR